MLVVEHGHGGAAGVSGVDRAGRNGVAPAISRPGADRRRPFVHGAHSHYGRASHPTRRARPDSPDRSNLAALGTRARLPMVGPIEAVFPGLRTSGFRVTSAASRDYNCIAWAAGDTAQWWWPDADPDGAIFWPPGVVVEETLAAFVAAFATLGYVLCSGEQLEAGFERVALFAKVGVPTHAARQLPSGRWTSKLGLREDVEHDLHAISGDLYGMVVLVLKRALPAAPAS